MYALVRSDLGMTSGKAAAQAGHAFVASFIKSDPDAQRAFTSDAGWTKVVLAAPDESTLWQAYRRADCAGIPAHLWIEDGVPVALGIGPLELARARPIVGKLKLYGAAPPDPGGELNGGAAPSRATSYAVSSV
jgi:peptidyl-tRNA hydrolase, PTH2 family